MSGDPPLSIEWRLALEVVLRRADRSGRLKVRARQFVGTLSELWERFAKHPSATPALLLEVFARRVARQDGASDEDAPQTEPDDRCATSRSKRLTGVRVLIVEDDPRDRSLALAVIAHGAEVFLECAAKSAADVIRRQTRAAKPFQVVLIALRTGHTKAVRSVRGAGHKGGIIALIEEPCTLSAELIAAGCDHTLDVRNSAEAVQLLLDRY